MRLNVDTTMHRQRGLAKDVQKACNLHHKTWKAREKLLRGRIDFSGKILQGRSDMSLLELGYTIWGGTEKFFAYLRQHGLLATAKNCSR